MKQVLIGAVVAAAAALLVLAPSSAAQAPGFLTLRGPGSSIGVSARDLTAEDARNARLDTPAGAYVESVLADSPAAKAGIQAGDVVVEFDGERVRSLRQFTRLVQETPPGRQVAVTVIRGAARQTLQVVPEASGRFTTVVPDGFGPDFERRFRERFRLDVRPDLRGFNDRPDVAGDILRRFDERGGAGRQLGVAVTPLTDQLAAYFGVKEGVLVTAVSSDTPAADAGLRAGDVITAVAGRPVNSVADLQAEFRRARTGEGLDISVTRDRKPLLLKLSVSGRAPSGSGRVPV